jgi:hypothetical protein
MVHILITYNYKGLTPSYCRILKFSLSVLQTLLWKISANNCTDDFEQETVSFNSPHDTELLKKYRHYN